MGSILEDNNSLILIMMSIIIISSFITLITIIQTNSLKRKLNRNNRNVDYLMNANNQYQELHQKINKIENNLDTLEENFSTMMYQIDEFSKQTIDNLKKVHEYLREKEMPNSYSSPLKSRDFDEVKSYSQPVHSLYKSTSMPEHNIKRNEDLLSNTQSNLKNVDTLSVNIRNLELASKNEDEIAKTLHMSKGEIELVKQLSKLRK